MRQLPKIDTNIPLSVLNDRMKGSMAAHIGIEYTEIHEDYLVDNMLVVDRTFHLSTMFNGVA